MKLNERQRSMLVAIAQAPRKPHYFTQDKLDVILSPDVVDRWLNKMVDAGYLVEENDIYSITVMGRQFLDIGGDTAEPAPVTWKTSTLNLDRDVGQAYMRPGSDHSHIKSRGMI